MSNHASVITDGKGTKMNMTRRDSLISIGLATAAGGRVAVRMPADRTGTVEALDEVVEARIAARHFPGVVVAVGWKDGNRLLKAHGHAQVKPHRVPMRPDTRCDLCAAT